MPCLQEDLWIFFYPCCRCIYHDSDDATVSSSWFIKIMDINFANELYTSNLSLKSWMLLAVNYALDWQIQDLVYDAFILKNLS
jgi:hypothetical protein